MNAPARIPMHGDPFDTIVVALARSLARQHHAASPLAATESTHAHRDLRPILEPAPEG